MSSLNENSEQNQFYNKILDDLKNLDIKKENSNEDSSIINELTELRRSVCGCSANKTDDVKIEIEISKENTESYNNVEDVENVVNESKPTAPKNEMTKKFSLDLSSNEISIELVESIAKLIAEISKNEECREALVDQNMFPSLNKCLSHVNLNDSARVQLCRAIGNLCYYNDKARLDFLTTCGLNDLFGLCKYCTTLDFTNSSDEEKKLKNTLITVVLGCVHNLTNENETLRKAAYEKNVIGLLKDFVPFLKNSNILLHYGSCLENLLELDEGKEQFVQEKLMLKLYEFMDTEFLTGLDENTEDFFATLEILNDQKLSKVYLCQTDFLIKVIEVMENSLNNSDDLLRHCSLFLVSLIVKEEKPDDMFAYKDGLILYKAIDWLCLFENDQLYIASAVIIANYLRSDESVQKILLDSRQPHVKILNLLKSYHAVTNQTLQHINLIHSFLGALRNFCVSVSHRTDILKYDLISIISPFISYENLEVKAKALSIIRLLVKNCTDKTGLDIIFSDSNLETIEKIALDVSIEHFTVIGESNRLICYLPIAAKFERNIIKLSKFQFVGIIVKQFKSEHFIMLNEGLLALNVLITINYGAFRDQLKSSDFNDNLKALFVKEAMPIEMRLNALKLFKFLVDKNDYFSNEQLTDHLKDLKSLKTAHSSNVLLVSCLSQLIDQLENLTA